MGRDTSLLDTLLTVLDIGVVNFTACDVREGWAVSFDPCRTASLHYCLSGCGSLVIRNEQSVPLEPHTFVLLPPGVAYRMESRYATPRRYEARPRPVAHASRETVPVVLVGTGEAGIFTACGEVSLGIAAGPDPFLAYGQPVVVRFGETGGLRDQFVMLLAESARPRMGSRALTEALLRQCLVLALRKQLEDGNDALPWLAGISDARLGRSMQAIFDQPAAPFTVERLAEIAQMSRSAFAARFAESFGQPPMHFVRIVRLRQAAEMLETTSTSVAEIARRVGFSSRSSFSSAFTAVYGKDPTGFRRAGGSR
ncbi:helix-turn-helix domain-containing protein [Paraburkholderia silvatlantica]|uniref:AraC family transcriptional regulator n=1 Tax=Paraburkholderia silvatlantica TaxID=321895 RepID=UPI0037506A72